MYWILTSAKIIVLNANVNGSQTMINSLATILASGANVINFEMVAKNWLNDVLVINNKPLFNMCVKDQF